MHKIAHTAILGALLAAIAVLNPGIGLGYEFTQISGPHFSLSEPWTVAQFNQMLITQSVRPDSVDSLNDLETTQGRTVKNSAGKVYFLESSEKYSDHGVCFVGLRNTVNGKQQVSFYTIQSGDDASVLLRGSGTSASYESDFGLDDVYAGTIDENPVKFIVVHEITHEEINCYHPEDADDEVSVSRCEQESDIVAYGRTIFAIGEDGKPVAIGGLGEMRKKGSNGDEIRESLAKKAKGIPKIETFKMRSDVTNPDLPEDIVCRVSKAKKTYTISCKKP